MAGLGLLGCCLLLIRWLFHAAARRHHQDPTIAELVAGQAAILCFSAGGILATLGTHIFDRVDLSARWISWRRAHGMTDQPIPAHAFVVVPDDELIAALAKFSAGRAPGRRRPIPWNAGGDHATPHQHCLSDGVYTDVA